MFIRVATSIGVFALLAACSDPGDESATIDIENSNSQMRIESPARQLSQARVIVIDSTDGSLSNEAALEDLTAANQGFSIPADPLVRTSLPNGTVLVEFGNRYVRPLVATIECDGSVKNSHNSEGITPIGSCQSQRGKSQ